MKWIVSHRADQEARLIADRHYNRQKPGTPQFVPPGRCFVLKQPRALWVTSWPFAEYVKHAWAGAWVNSCFRREGGQLASYMIRDAVSATRWKWPEVPKLGLITFVDAGKVKTDIDSIGKCYIHAGFKHVGFTKAGLWAFQLLPEDMPEPIPPKSVEQPHSLGLFN